MTDPYSDHLRQALDEVRAARARLGAWRTALELESGRLADAAQAAIRERGPAAARRVRADQLRLQRQHEEVEASDEPLAGEERRLRELLALSERRITAPAQFAGAAVGMLRER